MKKFAAILFITATFALNAFGQTTTPPTLRIVTESPNLPSELYYGDVKVKPLRYRPGTNTLITINDNDFFIQQQYVDFLRRFPETGGLEFYLNIMKGCAKTDVECNRYTRGALSANFFRSPEFQRKGSYVMYLYMVSLGQRPSTDAELADPNKNKFERPHYQEFMADLGSISDPNDQGTDAKKNTLTAAWLQRPEIQQRYGSLTNAAFVQKLLDTAGVTMSNQSALVADLNASRKTRAQVLRLHRREPGGERQVLQTVVRHHAVLRLPAPRPGPAGLRLPQQPLQTGRRSGSHGEHHGPRLHRVAGVFQSVLVGNDVR